MFDQLLAAPGVEEVVELRSTFGFMAFHGGSLERMTDVIARAAAEAAGASLYAVVQPDDLRWHIPSHVVGAHGSDGLSAFLDHVEVAVSLHGYGREGLWRSVLLGGANRELAAHVAAWLQPAVPHLDVVADLDAIPKAFRGVHPDNPVNRPRGGGVQVELPPGARGLTPRRHPVQPLVDGLAAAATAWPSPPA